MHLTSAGSVALTIWENDLRHWIGLVNVVFLVGLVVFLLYTAFSKRGLAEEKPAPNTKKFFDDEDLEGRRLERVLGWALTFVTIFAVAFLVYLVREPDRQAQSAEYFEEGAVARGATLFANAEMPEFDSVLSLQCANCHGTTGAGGSTTQVIDPDGSGPLPPQRYTWRAPALNTVLLRFSEEEVKQIITYGRPGTPMQAFGVAGGGAENEQTISDIVAFLRTIQLSEEEAKAQAEIELNGDPNADPPIPGARGQAQAQLEAAEAGLESATESLDKARATVTEALGIPASTRDEAIADDCNELAESLAGKPSVDEATQAQGRACRTFLNALSDFEDAQAELDWSIRWAEARKNVSDGQLLFELYCARCHTQGWSIFDPTTPNGTNVLGLAGGGGGTGGGIGFNLRDGATLRRFGSDDAGFTLHEDFVRTGSEANQQYGRGGIGSGRMPGFGAMLTDDMIRAIVEYEREGLDQTSYDIPAAPRAARTED